MVLIPHMYDFYICLCDYFSLLQVCKSRKVRTAAVVLIVFLVLNPMSNAYVAPGTYYLKEKRKQEIVIYLSILKSIQLY